jgi:signal transduction histidine kinase/CheY-like chemotaxis protein/HAMP domain-containing protein
MLLVLSLGYVSYNQNALLTTQIEEMYDHPLKVRNAFFEIKVATLDSSVELRNLLREVDPVIQEEMVIQINNDYAIIDQNYLVIRDYYLGPKDDVNTLHSKYIAWKAYRQITIQSILDGNLIEASNRMKADGLGENYRQEFLDSIDVIDEFSSAKSLSLYEEAFSLHQKLLIQIILFVSFIVLAELLVNYLLIRQILTPLKSMTSAANQFNLGDMSARSTYTSNNEFGSLSTTFNSLLEQVEKNVELLTEINTFSDAMISSYTTHDFFRILLQQLCAISSSEVAAVYVEDEQKGSYSLFESLGLDKSIKRVINKEGYQGEFIKSIFSKKLERIIDIDDSNIMVINSVHGNILPKEIITIPILMKNEVVALISLSSIHSYSDYALEFLNNVIKTMDARVESILANMQIEKFLKELEAQNRELESQQVEMESMNQELEEQNIELELQKQQLKEANLQKTSFLSTMSHELRTPLNSVIALSGVLNRKLKSQIPEEEHRYLEIIERNGKNLLLLINDILDISRIESGKTEINITKFNACQVVQELVENAKAIAKEKNIEVIDMCEHSNMQISTDEDKFIHILQNLLSNAIKFTEKGSVTISSKIQNDFVEIQVKDTGIGIPKSVLPYIFNEFRQADTSTARKYGGTGLGLAIAKKYAMMLEGNISVESEASVGSVFTLYIPMKLSQNLEKELMENDNLISYKANKDRINAELTNAPKHLLLIDDNEPTQIQIKDLLNDEGYSIATANDVKEAFKEIKIQKPDAVILDIMLPETDGFELLKMIRNRNDIANVPVLVLTSKQISKTELGFLKRNNVHQLIQKGDVNRVKLIKAISSMFDFSSKTTVNKEEKPIILIVEDNPDNMISAISLLGDKFQCIEATNGQEGVDKAAKYIPDLILMDIALPVMDGIHAFQRIRSLPKCALIPIIALTASVMVQDRESILSYGFDAFIPKPLNENEFFKVIGEVLYGK